MRLAQKVLLHVYQHWHVQLLQHISYLTPNITYAASPGLNLSATGTGWVNGKLTFSSNCSLPLRWCKGILLLHSFAVPGSWDLCGLFVDYRWCGGWEVVLCIFWHRWESKVAFTALKGRLLHPHFCLCWRGEGTFQGDSPLSCSCHWERFQQDRGTRQNWRGCIYSCLHACSISFTPLRILPCGISGFFLSWGETDYSTEAAWHCFCHSQTSCIRLTFPVSTMEWKAVNPARCEWLYIGIT